MVKFYLIMLVVNSFGGAWHKGSYLNPGGSKQSLSIGGDKGAYRFTVMDETLGVVP